MTLVEIEPYLFEHQFFIPSEVGLRNLQPDILTLDDHIWHEVSTIEQTPLKPDSTISSEELKKCFIESHASDWNIGAVLAQKDFL